MIWKMFPLEGNEFNVLMSPLQPYQTLNPRVWGLNPELHEAYTLKTKVACEEFLPNLFLRTSKGLGV